MAGARRTTGNPPTPHRQPPSSFLLPLPHGRIIIWGRTRTRTRAGSHGRGKIVDRSLYRESAGKAPRRGTITYYQSSQKTVRLLLAHQLKKSDLFDRLRLFTSPALRGDCEGLSRCNDSLTLARRIVGHEGSLRRQHSLCLGHHMDRNLTVVSRCRYDGYNPRRRWRTYLNACALEAHAASTLGATRIREDAQNIITLLVQLGTADADDPVENRIGDGGGAGRGHDEVDAGIDGIDVEVRVGLNQKEIGIEVVLDKRKETY